MDSAGQDKVKVTNLKNLPKLQISEFWIKRYTQHTFWSRLIRCVNMKWIRQYCWNTERTRFCTQTDKMKPVYPLQLRWAGGIIMLWWLSGKTNAITPITHWPCDAIWQQEFWVNIGSGNGLFPDGTKPLPKPMLTDHQWSPVTFILGQFHKRCLNHQSLKFVWKLHV